MASGEPITRRQVHTLLTDHFGGTDAEGRWSVRDAHLALELAQAEYLHAGARIDLAASVVDAEQMFSALETKLPTQTHRSNEQRSEERRVGKECVRTLRYRWARYL